MASASADHLGFHVHRGDMAGPQLQLTTTLLRGGREYRFVDASAPAGGAHYWLAEWSDAGVTWHGPVELASLPASAVFLQAGQPNPFQVTTSIRFGLERGGRAVLRVYDVRGREVRRLFDGDGDGRSHVVTWDGEDAAGRRLAPGVYYCRLQAGARTLTRKLQLAP